MLHLEHMEQVLHTNFICSLIGFADFMLKIENKLLDKIQPQNNYIT